MANADFTHTNLSATTTDPAGYGTIRSRLPDRRADAPDLHAAISDKNRCWARLLESRTAVARWPRGGDPLPAKLAADQLAAELAYNDATQRAEALLQRRREKHTEER